jgi:DNA-3-methyladenine glycosylase II
MNDAARRRSRRGRSTAGISAHRWASAVRHLRRVDPHLRAIIDRIGPCRLEPYPDRFGALIRSIVGQQISSKAARSINLKLIALSGDPHRPERLIELGETSLKSVGLSGAKARYVLNLAQAVASGEVPLDEFDDSWEDEAITRALTAIKGIGVWTAEMFLIFALNRPDILPASDLGVRVALRDRHGLAELPRPRDCHSLAEIWRPYRTVASWYIWRGTDTPPARLVTPPVKVGRPRSRSKPGEST